MSVSAYHHIFPPSAFFPRPQYIQCQRRLPVGYGLSEEGFLREVYGWLYHHYEVQSWQISEEPRSIYSKVVSFGQSTLTCLIHIPSFVIKKVELQITLDNNFAVSIRLLREQVVEWIDIREDPFRPGHNLCRWPKPLDPKTRVVNTDGSLSLEKKRAAIGCVFRSHQGEPLGAYSALCDEKMAIHIIETWAAREGLRITAAGNVKVVLLATDATIAVSLINTVAAAYSDLVNKCRIDYHNYLQESSKIAIRASSPKEDKDLESYVKSVVISHGKWTNGVDQSSLEFLVKSLIDIVYYLESFDHWGCRHIMREANRAADLLTKVAENGEVILVKKESYPAKLLRVIEDDANETWYQRVKPAPISNKCTKSTGWMLT